MADSKHPMTTRGQVLANLTKGVMESPNFLPLAILGLDGEEFSIIIPVAVKDGPLAKPLMRAKFRGAVEQLLKETFPLEDD